jgi:hypothetical protein
MLHSQILAASLILTAPLPYSLGGSVGMPSTIQLPSHTKAPLATTRLQTAVREYALWINGKKWTLNKYNSLGELKLSHINGKITAKVDTDRVATDTSVLRGTLLEELKRADPNARTISEDRRVVNGREIVAIQFAVKAGGDRFRVFGYYHGGSSGQIQVIAYTPDSAFAEQATEITELLDGLEVKDQDLPASANDDHIPYPGLLKVSSTISVSFDPTKWRQASTTDARFFDFMNPSGHGLAEVGVERQTMANAGPDLGIQDGNDIYPEYLLASYQASNPKAKLLSKEKRTVNGNQVWFVKLETGRQGKMPGDKELLWGYYYSDSGGTIEAQVFGDKSFFKEYEQDVMSFLNGLRISEVGNHITRNFEWRNRRVFDSLTVEPPLPKIRDVLRHGC